VSALDTLWRKESGRVRASLIRLLRDYELAEEALNDAFLAAAETWPRDGWPANPRAWLVSAGRFRALDRLRRTIRHREIVAALPQEEEAVDPSEPLAIADDVLRLVFVCCHPALPPEAQLAMTLREVAGLTTEEVAAAFLAKPTTIAQRIVRAKARIRELALPFEVPDAGDLPQRLDRVAQVIYLIFSEGYAASTGDAPIRADLCAEAIRLARLLRDLCPSPDCDGLLALLLLQHARRAARLDAAGALVTLDRQDRDLWDQAMIDEGLACLGRAMAADPVAPITIEAAIAAEHCRATTASATNWARIVHFYDLLLGAQPSPVTALNRAVALAMRDGPAAGLSALAPLADDLASYRYFHSVRGELLRDLGRADDALAAYRAALALNRQAAERAFLLARIAELSNMPEPANR
jgi:RNA polymerase sigma-70 factor (ECF subfamily)